MADILEDDDLALAYDLAADTPWNVNAFGLWCPACGWLAVAPWSVEEGCFIPTRCGECGHD